MENIQKLLYLNCILYFYTFEIFFTISSRLVRGFGLYAYYDHMTML